MVGMAARVRRASATSPSGGSGTWTSARRRTDRPVGSGRSSSWATSAIVSGLLASGAEDEVDHPVRVAPLVVVPAKHLYEASHRQRERGVEGARRRRADDV